HLTFIQQPSDTLVNSVITPNVKVGVYDNAGLLVRYGILDAIDLAIGTNPPGTGQLSQTSATISTAPVSGVIGGGIATFNTASIDTVGTGYTLQASGGPLSTVTSNTFDIYTTAHTITASVG